MISRRHTVEEWGPHLESNQEFVIPNVATVVARLQFKNESCGFIIALSACNFPRHISCKSMLKITVDQRRELSKHITGPVKEINTIEANSAPCLDKTKKYIFAS